MELRYTYTLETVCRHGLECHVAKLFLAGQKKAEVTCLSRGGALAAIHREHRTATKEISP